MGKTSELKNKNKFVVKWPTTPFFILEDVFALNPPPIKRITLRVRLQKEKLDKGLAAEIGCLTGDLGRPRKVFAFTPVPQTTLDLARNQKITLVDQSKLQKVSTVSPTALVNKNQSVVTA